MVEEFRQEAAASAPTAQTNDRPLLKTAGLTAGLYMSVILLTGVLGSRNSQPPAALGRILADLTPGCLGLSIWAARARSRWSPEAWLWRFVVCLLASLLAIAFPAVGEPMGIRGS